MEDRLGSLGPVLRHSFSRAAVAGSTARSPRGHAHVHHVRPAREPGARLLIAHGPRRLACPLDSFPNVPVPNVPGRAAGPRDPGRSPWRPPAPSKVGGSGPAGLRRGRRRDARRTALRGRAVQPRHEHGGGTQDRLRSPGTTRRARWRTIRSRTRTSSCAACPVGGGNPRPDDPGSRCAAGAAPAGPRRRHPAQAARTVRRAGAGAHRPPSRPQGNRTT
jgi:hypothetical protein